MRLHEFPNKIWKFHVERFWREYFTDLINTKEMLELLQTNASRIISKEQEYLADNLLAFQTYQKETEGFDVVHDLNGDENSRTRSDENPKFEKFLQAKDTLLAMLEKNSEELKKSLLSSK